MTNRPNLVKAYCQWRETNCSKAAIGIFAVKQYNLVITVCQLHFSVLQKEGVNILNYYPTAIQVSTSTWFDCFFKNVQAVSFWSCFLFHWTIAAFKSL